MKQAGRASILIILAVVCAIGITGLVIFSSASPKQIANDFMIALATGDVDNLLKIGYLGNDTETEAREKWEFATKVAGPYFRFKWRVGNMGQPDPESATVEIFMDTGTGSEEKYELSLLRRDGQWRVDVGEINRNMYPGLPR